MPEIIFKTKKLAYNGFGKGFPIVLLHGYLETKEVWTPFAELLSNTNRIISIDIPGHGKSEVFGETHSMELMAECINAVLNHLGIEKCLLVGHSMGGYIALAFANLYAEKLSGLVLFHSSVYADTDEKRVMRNREIDLFKQGKKELILSANLPNMFATQNVERFSDALKTIKSYALKMSVDGISSLLRGMIARRDQQEFVQQFNKPMLFIFGEKDNYISIELAQKMLALNSKIKVAWLKSSGHMGFIEEKENGHSAIRDFVNGL